MIYVYALAELPPPDVSGILGIGDRPIDFLTSNQAVAIYSESQAERISPTAENLWRHESVVESLLKRCPALLPLRFGEVLSVVSLREILSRHGGTVAASLERVRDSVELGVRILSPLKSDMKVAQESSKTAEAGAFSSGREYMCARLASEQKMRDSYYYFECLGKIIHSALAPLAQDSTRRLHDSANSNRGVLVTSAYLVRRGQIDEFVARVRELSTENPDVKLICTGPWPTYNFVPVLNLKEPTHG